MANGSGQRSDRYGRIADNLVSARLATPSGLWSSENFRHAASGPWLGGLVAGSEGLFGILTDATLQAARHARACRGSGLAAAVVPGSGRCGAPARAGAAMRWPCCRISDEAETAFLSQFRLARDGLAEPPFLERDDAPSEAGAAAGHAWSLPATRAPTRAPAAPSARPARFSRKTGGVSLGRRPGNSWRKSRYEAPHLRESLMARGLGVDTFETAVPWSRPRSAACRGQPRDRRKRAARRWTARAARSCSAISATPMPKAPASISRRSSRAAPQRAHAMARDQAGGDRGDRRQWRHRSATIMASAPTMPSGLARQKGELGFRLLGAVAATLDPSGRDGDGRAEGAEIARAALRLAWRA